MKSNKETETNQLDANAQNFADRCVASCRKILAQLEAVKASVVSEFRDRLEDHQYVLDLAVNEAEALAWEAGVPELLFPTLATEKANAVARWYDRQQTLLRRTKPQLLAA
jgi:hypothetical protein